MAFDNRRRGFIQRAFLLVILLQAITCSTGQLQDLLRDCCARGAEWGGQDPSRPQNGCYNAPGPGRTHGIPQEHLPSCLSMSFICCLKHRRNDMCELGKESALLGDRCNTGNAEGGEFAKDCCEACKLGLVFGRIDSTCRLIDVDIGFPWASAFLDCCLRSSSSDLDPSTTIPTPTSTPTTPGGTDFCLLHPGGQPCAHKCINTKEGFVCECHDGYRLNPADQKSCLPGVDACHRTNPCEQLCTDTGTTVECDCFAGFELSNDLVNCNDIDECASGIDDCDPLLERCINRAGAYLCQSRDGSTRQPNAIPNGPHGIYNRTKCPIGYEYVASTATCQDIDECLRHNHTCGPRLCQNTIGSYVCQQRIETSQCPPGYKHSALSDSCIDVDECADGLDACNRNREFCLNLQGTYECQLKTLTTCPAGYKYNTAAQSCEDIDECREKLDDCDRTTETCLNAIGGYDCTGKTQAQCPPGYKPTSGQVGLSAQSSCEDVDECQEGLHQCDPTSEICVNDVGRYRCEVIGNGQVNNVECSQGTRWNTDYQQCIDIDECVENTHNCNPVTEACINIDNGFQCREIQCPAGYRANITARTCQDIDECLLGTHNCDHRHECVNDVGSFTCREIEQRQVQCPPGHQLNTDTRQCEDVDECHLGFHNCLHGKKCVNNIGSFTCKEPEPVPQCPSGHRLNANTRQCEDIDECLEESHTCNRQREICVNSDGGFRCFAVRCPHGYRPNITSQYCEDIDECAENRHDCSPHEECTNTHGGYSCKSAIQTPTCPSGHVYNPSSQLCQDIDECSDGQSRCNPLTHSCVNTVGNYTCQPKCPSGYTYSLAERGCRDDNECEIGSHNCGPTYTCHNTAGSFRCVRKTCPHGRLEPDGRCVPITCSPGKEPNVEGHCVDINECTAGNACRHNQRCVNTDGSFHCQNLLTCGAGYEINDSGSQCIDIDECSKGTHDCKQSQTCTNRQGGYTCQCPEGYTFNAQRHCEDIDECTRFSGQICSSNSDCQNTQGSYTCRCKAGFKQADDGKNCGDINECEQFAHLCQHTCINTWGSYQCTCKSGFKLHSDGRSCDDIDECTAWQGQGSLCIGNCVNTPGTYTCSCPPGYKLSQDQRTCQDIDECTQGLCGSDNEVCLNTRGAYKCNRIVCPQNYIKDQQHKNRCKRQSLICQQSDKECLEQPLAYSYNFITLVSNLPISPSGQVNLFTMRGPLWSSTTVEFDFSLKSARAHSTRDTATREHFQMQRTNHNQAVVSIVRVIKGPQEIELELTMRLHHNNVFGGIAVAKIFIYVSEHEF